LNRAADILGDGVSQQWVRDCHLKKKNFWPSVVHQTLKFRLQWAACFSFRNDAKEVLSKQLKSGHLSQMLNQKLSLICQ